MSKFTTELNVKLKNQKVWIVTDLFVYESDLIGKVNILEGFETDLASVPRIPLIYSLWGGRAHREAVVHDYLFRSNSRPVTTLSTANKVLLEAMTALKKPWYIRYPMYWGVCMGSYRYFHKKKVEDRL